MLSPASRPLARSRTRVFVPNSRKGRRCAPVYRTGSIPCPTTFPSAGVDVGLRWLDLGFYPFVKPIRAPNSDQGIETIIAALRERGAVKVALEAIGGYGRKLVAALIGADFRVFVVNPRRIKAFRDAEGLIAKTDRLDAALIARFAYRMAHELRSLPNAEQAILKALATRRRQLTKSIAIEKTRLKQAFDPLIVNPAGR